MKKLLLLVLTLCLLALPAAADVIINEIMTNNGVFINGERYDWIELYNNGTKAVNLSGWGLSESKKDPLKWTFPQGTTLAGNSYLVVYCVGEGETLPRNTKSNFYAPYKLSDGGESIVLSNAAGEQQDLLKYPEQFGNTTYGVVAGTGEWGFFEKATPKAANAKTVYQEQSERPVFETEPGFYTIDKSGNVQVVLTGEGEIRYTTDGSEPTRSSKVYTRPITLTKTTVIRARTVEKDKLMSTTVGATYFINDPAPVMVVSLSTDDKYLFDPQIGVFVRGTNEKSNYMYDWEYPIHVELFDEDGVRQIAQIASFHITGTSTRGYPQKSMGLYARDAYGDENRFYYNPFDNRDYESYKALQLRSTGSDGNATRMRDVVLTSLSNGMGLMYQDAKPIIVYVNGEYWGQYNIREKVNKHSIAQWEGVTDEALIDQIDVLEGSAEDHQVQNGTNAEWLALRNFVRNNSLNTPENLAYVTEQLDVDNFFTWVSLQIGFRNSDLENVRVYRVPGGKWKYVLYDLDAGGDADPRAIYMLLDSSRSNGRVSSHYSLLNKLIKVPEMKDRFLTVFADVMEKAFLYETVVDPVIDYWEGVQNELLPRHCKRFTSMTFSEWRTNVNAFRYAIRTTPAKTIDEVAKIMKLDAAEKNHYFGHVLELLKVQNAKDKH